MRFVVLFVVLSAVLAVAGYYVHQRTSGTFRLGPRARKLLAAAIFAGMGSTLLGRALSSAGGAVAEQVAVAGSMVSLAVIVSAVLLLAIDGAHGVGWLTRHVVSRARGRAEAPEDATEREPGLERDGDRAAEARPAGEDASASSTMPRRAFLGRAAAGGALFVGGSSSFYGALFGRHDYQLEEVAVPVRGLARALDGFTIVQLSDIHFGMFVGEPELRAAVALVRRARPDLVVVTGDMLDHDVRFAPLLGKLVRALEPLARYGVAVVPGNHDYYAGIDDVLATARAAGAAVLRNSARVIGDRAGAFALVGVDDLWARRLATGRGPDLHRALSMAPAGLARVLLCHNPAYFPEAAGEVALQLSGHTHGGQIWPWGYLVRLTQPYLRGLARHGPTQIYVSCGTGYWGPPMRLGARPEITLVELGRA